MSIFKSLGYTLGRIFGKKGTMAKNNQGQRIASAVTEFVNNHIGLDFTAKELRSFVLSRVEDSAPASSDRIMRQLRQTGVINYELVKRQLSLYRGLPVFVIDEAGIEQIPAVLNYADRDTWVNPPHDQPKTETIN